MGGSRVFRQTVALEIIWIVEDGAEPPYTDWEAEIRGSIAGSTTLGSNGFTVVGAAEVGDVEELCVVIEGG